MPLRFVIEHDSLGPHRACESRGSSLMLFEKGTNFRRDFYDVSFEREMTGVIEMDRGIRVIALERLRTGRQKKRIVPAPNREQRWF